MTAGVHRESIVRALLLTLLLLSTVAIWAEERPHDRIVYERASNDAWNIKRIAP